VGGDDEDVVAAVAIGGEGNLLAVGAEHGGDVVRLVHGHGAGDAPDGLDGPDIAEVAEGDQLAVGRDVGLAGEADGLLRLRSREERLAGGEEGQGAGAQEQRTDADHGWEILSAGRGRTLGPVRRLARREDDAKAQKLTAPSYKFSVPRR